MTKQTLLSLEQAAPAPDSAAGELLSILKMENGQTPQERLKAAIVAYASEIMQALEDPARRSAELDRLYCLAISVRKRVLADETLGSLDETRGTLLFPSSLAETSLCPGSG